MLLENHKKVKKQIRLEKPMQRKTGIKNGFQSSEFAAFWLSEASPADIVRFILLFSIYISLLFFVNVAISEPFYDLSFKFLDTNSGSTMGIFNENKFSKPKEIQITASPNPFNSAIDIKVPHEIEKIHIFDIIGNKVAQLDAENGYSKWKPMDDIKSGVYCIKPSKN